jgi:hypothetical protein
MNRSKSPLIKKPEFDLKQRGTSKNKTEYNKSIEKTKTTVKKTNTYNSLKFSDNFKQNLKKEPLSSKSENKRDEVKSNSLRKSVEEPSVPETLDKKEKKHIKFEDSPNTKLLSNDNKRFSILDVPGSAPKNELIGRNKAYFIIANSE